MANFLVFAETRGADLRKVAGDAQNWAGVEPSIFGTLFERILDPKKRAQIGAHYTSREDILLHQLPDRVEDDGEALVVILQFVLDAGELAAELVAGQDQLPQPHERPHHLDARLDRHRAVQDRREHDRAVLGEGVGQIPATASGV